MAEGDNNHRRSNEQIDNDDGNVNEDSAIPNKLDSNKIIKSPGPRF